MLPSKWRLSVIVHMNTIQQREPVVQVSEADFESQVLGAGKPVVVAFWAPWSRACQLVEWQLGEIASACAGSARVAKINADDSPALGLWYDVDSIPSLLFFVDGTLQDRMVGTASREAILAKLRAIPLGCEGTGSSPHTKPSA
jgi:thioredoxin 1